MLPLKAVSHDRIDFEVLISKESAGDADHNDMQISFKKCRKSFFEAIVWKVRGQLLKGVVWIC